MCGISFISKVIALAVTVLLLVGGTASAVIPDNGAPFDDQTAIIDAVHNNVVDFSFGGAAGYYDCFTVVGEVTGGGKTLNGTSLIGKDSHPVMPKLARVLLVKFDALSGPNTPRIKGYHPLSDYYYRVVTPMDGDTVTFVIKAPLDYRGPHSGGLIKLGIPRGDGVGGQLTLTDNEKNCPA